MTKKQIILFIDTSNQDTASVAVEVHGTRYEKTSKSRIMKAQMVLPLIEELLGEHRIKPSDITEIFIHVGPGSFTGLRVGLAVANMMGKLLGIPVNGKHVPVIPRYDRDW